MFQTVFHWTPGSISGVGIEGAKICEDGTDNCELTNAEGKAVLYLPPNQEVAISIEKEGYGLLLNADVTDETFFSAPNDPLYTHEILEAVAADLGVEYPWQGGVVRFVRGPVSTGVSGVTFEPVGASVGQVGDPVYYDTATERYSRDLEATTGVLQAWSLPISDGGFVDVPPGVHEFEYGGAAGDCTLSFGWPGSGLNRLRLPVRDGYITYGSMGCE
jgi:hypothetical protein